ncbi:sigma-54 dependent transcriptional regulator [Sphaerochaeta sp. PS]|uniref:sigma-54-dependent transcriptional regulator n=1 Tax=Sphaerochaeta sp. PS TaxID=3076336 RepID=UPI0028A4DF46|nr:sigma-54 dependent transcriptional regulator [Sphaerochaeta sp. PS]MDT4761895.1 sigma-54 dependent transcriptional regulator [Sphaerochaeta sp. PS]
MKILIVDDETNIRELMHRYLHLDGIDSDCAENGLSAQRMLKDELYDACLIDLKMPGMDGNSLIEWIRSEGFRMPIIMVSAHGEISDAVSALKQGAQDYIVKPFDPEELVIRLKKLVEAQNLRNLVENETRNTTVDDKQIFVGESPSIRKIKDLVARIAETNSTVLITGESGTGKEVVARDIHNSSLVKGGPFVAINIGGVPENLLESELFGYEKGAFTGAANRKTGMFELASGGTLFLDEIGDMPLSLQVKILRVLQDKRITRLGGTDPMPINARIIAATNKDVEQMVREGKFREDLFYRLNVVRISIPPLRERREDIPLLAAGILRRFNRQMGHRVEGFTSEALSMLTSHDFFGNVRELENILERAVIFSDTPEIQVEDLDLRGSVSMRTHDKEKEETKIDLSDGKSLKDVEIDTIIRALHRWEGNRTRAAQELGISRRTLINKIAENNLNL